MFQKEFMMPASCYRCKISVSKWKVKFVSLIWTFFPLSVECRFSTAQKLDKLGMRGSDTYDNNTLSKALSI